MQENRPRLTLEEARELQWLCSQFEEEWRRGDKPQIEHTILKAQMVPRRLLFEDLMQIEFDLRLMESEQNDNKAGSRPSCGDEIRVELKKRFSNEGDLITKLVDSKQPLIDKDSNESLSRKLFKLQKDGRYEFIHELARGGSGAVWRVFDRRLNRYSAIKVLLDGNNSLQMQQRLEQEARICARLQHPGIVPVHELGHFADGSPFVCMKLIEGRTFAEILDGPKQLTTHNSISIFTKVCEAVAYAHDQGIIHRDLKPSNIMVGEFGEVQVMDWGLAKDLKEVEVSLSRPFNPEDTIFGKLEATIVGSVFGTLAYMPPEQARGEVDNISKRSDVFALGGILVKILTGSPIYECQSAASLYHLARNGEVENALNRLRKVRVHHKLKSLAKSCIATAPSDRPQDSSEVLSQLRLIDRPRKFLWALAFTGATLITAVFLVIALTVIIAVYFTKVVVTE